MFCSAGKKNNRCDYRHQQSDVNIKEISDKLEPDTILNVGLNTFVSAASSH